MKTHSCEWCSGSKARRQLVALLLLQPNMTTTRASERLGITRSYLAGQRAILEEKGCVPRRTIDGRGQGHVERAFSKAKTTGGHPIAHTLPGEVDAVADFYRPKHSGYGYPLGTTWTDTSTRRVA